MRKTLVWDLIVGFSNAEIRRFRRFLASPYFNQREDLRAFFSFLLTSRQKGKVPSKEMVFEKVYPEKLYDGQEMRLLLSYFLKLIERFLVIEKFEEDHLAKPALLLSVYREKNLDRHFQKTLNHNEKSLANQPLRHSEFYLHHLMVEQQRLLFQAKSGRTKKLNLQVLEDDLDYTFISMKLRQACTSLSHQAVFNTQYRIGMMDEILALAQKPQFLAIPAVSVYYHCYLALFGEQNENHFQNFKSVLFDNTARFPKEELRSLYLTVINFCIKKINENKREYLKEALDLYKKGLEENIVLENEKLSRFTYNNIVGIAMHLGELEWVEGFVETYRHHLEVSYQTTAYSLNSARIAYARKQYDRALVFLQKADYQDLINNMVAKILQMKIYYEMGETDVLYAHLQTMRMFIRRNKKISYHHQNWKNIVKYTQKLMEVNPFDKTAKNSLRKAIEREDILTEKEWLLGMSV